MIVDIVIVVGLTCLSAVLVHAMIRLGRLDQPGPRSSHQVPTPKGGGVGVAASFVAGSITFATLHGVAGGSREVLAAIVLAATFLAAVAFLDDLFDWPFSIKLGAQALAAACIVAAGCRIVSGTGWLDNATLAMFSLCWLLVVTNAMNFIDGLNGLAGGVTLLAALFLVFAARPQGVFVIEAPALALAAGLAGFLPFNYPRARIFIGDVGSQLCGFVIGALGVLVASRPALPGHRLLVPLILSGVLFDVVFTLLRRALRGSPLTQAHREHLYQLAQRSGMQAPVVTLIHWVMAVWGGACALSLDPDSSFPGLLQAVVAALAPQILWLSYVAGRSRKASLPF